MAPITKYSLLIYSTHTINCLYHKVWNQDASTASKEDRESLLFGLLFSLNRTALKMSPKDKPGLPSSLTTSKYKMHIYQTVTGYTFVILTSQNAPNLREKLRSFFTQVFLPNVIMNPTYELDEVIKIPSFDAAVDNFDWEKKSN
ncbi:trafficking protein particle complex subunit 1 [Histomonas meleagridis]|uniref:trafficking protein particle complex subunit 1 n=1 Tax=Histomonas meleagridis TaxID=135588 RepID=UPI00355A94A4|nr:trafficking protein particle complex subunit 1 [Histomonas meleagridis]KAH0802987.1 trafficking protein particle complex subunit 1 [Histomonas meleagridis]